MVKLKTQLLQLSRVSINVMIVQTRPCKIIELSHDKTNKVACAPSVDSDQPGPPPSLIRVFAVRSMGS